MREDCFDAWSPEMAYVLGHLWADGCVTFRSKGSKGTDYQVIYGIAASDLSLLKQLAVFYGAPPERVKLYRQGRVARLALCSKRLVETLINDHGLAQRKTWGNHAFPANIPPEMLHHFVRGFFDGDGHIGLQRQGRKVTVGFTASPAFMDGLIVATRAAIPLAQPTRTPNGVVEFARWSRKDDVLSLRGWLYQDATIWLHRKRERFDIGAVALRGVQGRKVYAGTPQRPRA